MKVIDKIRANKYALLIGCMAILLLVVVVYVLTGDAVASGTLLATVPMAGTVTTQSTQEAAAAMGEDIVMSDVERKVTLLRPDIAPLDTMLRSIGSKPTNSFEVKWGESGFGDGYVEALNAVSQNTAGTPLTIKLTPATYKLVVASSVFLYEDATIGKNVCLYVLSKNNTNQEILCQVIGGAGTGDQIGSGGMAANTQLFYNGVAKSELDAQTESFQQMPEIYSNYCQIQMCQIEQGLYDQKQKKELDWGLLDFKSDALYNFRYGCENTALMGIKSTFKNLEGKDIYMAGGLESYVGWHLKYVPNAAGTAGGLDINRFFELGEAVFTNIAGSDSRVFFVSPQLMTSLLKNVEFQKMMRESKTNMVYGLRCSEIDTGHGLLNIRTHRGLGKCRPGQGAVVDLNRIKMRVFDSMHWRDVELLKSGQSKADAWTLEERTTYEFRAKSSHAWIYPVVNAAQAGVVEL
jgi:hypothetical protein